MEQQGYDACWMDVGYNGTAAMVQRAHDGTTGQQRQ